MNHLPSSVRLQENLETYLNRSCEAEAKGDIPEAERLFKLALGCEGLSQPGVGNVSEYVQRAGPVYKQDQVISLAGNVDANRSEINDMVSDG